MKRFTTTLSALLLAVAMAWSAPTLVVGARPVASVFGKAGEAVLRNSFESMLAVAGIECSETGYGYLPGVIGAKTIKALVRAYGNPVETEGPTTVNRTNRIDLLFRVNGKLLLVRLIQSWSPEFAIIAYCKGR